MKDFPLYEFYWEGKAESKLLATSTTSKQLILDKKRSKNLNSTQNIYIEGDNLDGLKLLLADYKNKVKMIYIDPPYNSNFAIKTVEYIIEKKIADKNSTIIIETDSEEKILEELKKIDIKITDKRRYGRATLIFIKIGKG